MHHNVVFRRGEVDGSRKMSIVMLRNMAHIAKHKAIEATKMARRRQAHAPTPIRAFERRPVPPPAYPARAAAVLRAGVCSHAVLAAPPHVQALLERAYGP